MADDKTLPGETLPGKDDMPPNPTIEPPKPPEPANTDTPPRVGDPSRQPS